MLPFHSQGSLDTCLAGGVQNIFFVSKRQYVHIYRRTVRIYVKTYIQKLRSCDLVTHALGCTLSLKITYVHMYDVRMDVPYRYVQLIRRIIRYDTYSTYYRQRARAFYGCVWGEREGRTRFPPPCTVALLWRMREETDRERERARTREL